MLLGVAIKRFDSYGLIVIEVHPGSTYNRKCVFLARPFSRIRQNEFQNSATGKRRKRQSAILA